MVFDNKEHQSLILEMFQQINFPGKFIDLAYEVKQAVRNAEIAGEAAPATEAGAGA